MAKNFPYFKFTATEWLTGDIVYESLELQGLFINVCALYWQRDGKLTIEDLIRRYKNESLIKELIDRYIWNMQGNILIKFLDEQLIEANHISKVNSENGKKGAEAKRNKANAKRPLNDSKAILSKEEKEEEINKNKNKNKIKEFVFLSESELNKLNEEFANHEVEWMLNKLNDYKASTGKKYKSDYAAINMWVKYAFKKAKVDFIKDNNTSEVRIATAMKAIENINWDDYTKQR
ncbi:MAG: Cellulophaga phage phi19:1 [Bacteroidota bacterium]|jgi:hypothetical protein